MDLCHPKNSELEHQYQKYKGGVVLRGDTVKDDSGSYAVFTEQGSSASQMTAAKVMDIVSKLPGCAGQAPEAISACTQVKNGGCTNVIENSRIRKSRYLDTSTKTQMAQIMVQYGTPSCSSCAESVRSSFGRAMKYGWKKVSDWECLFVHREKGLLLFVYVDDIKLAGKKQNIRPTLKFLVKDVDLGKPTSFLDHVHLGCTQRECQIGKDIVVNYRSMFESRISAGATEKLPETKATVKPDAETILSWSYDMEGHAKKRVERYCELANRTTKQLYKVAPQCMDDHQL